MDGLGVRGQPATSGGATRRGREVRGQPQRRWARGSLEVEDGTGWRKRWMLLGPWRGGRGGRKVVGAAGHTAAVEASRTSRGRGRAGTRPDTLRGLALASSRQIFERKGPPRAPSATLGPTSHSSISQVNEIKADFQSQVYLRDSCLARQAADKRPARATPAQRLAHDAIGDVVNQRLDGCVGGGDDGRPGDYRSAAATADALISSVLASSIAGPNSRGCHDPGGDTRVVGHCLHSAQREGQ